MSDTVKLIIEIPKDIYERCKEYKLWSYDAETLEGAVATSKPLSENKGDLISRQAVIDALTKTSGIRGDALKALYDLPSVEKKGEWIPVTERLPKIADVYRVTRRLFDNQIDTEPYYIVDACFFDGSDTWHNDNRINHKRGYANDVIAWQENPEPYKAESEE